MQTGEKVHRAASPDRARERSEKLQNAVGPDRSRGRAVGFHWAFLMHGHGTCTCTPKWSTLLVPPARYTCSMPVHLCVCVCACVKETQRERLWNAGEETLLTLSEITLFLHLLASWCTSIPWRELLLISFTDQNRPGPDLKRGSSRKCRGWGREGVSQWDGPDLKRGSSQKCRGGCLWDGPG